MRHGTNRLAEAAGANCIGVKATRCGVKRVGQFVKFCIVGGSGVVVDMAVLHFLAEPRWLGWNLTAAKVCAAETALLNNFFWNEVWTFRSARPQRTLPGVVGRVVRFHAICGLGLVWAVLLLHLFHTAFGVNLYAANFLAIGVVTVWNFGLNAWFNWGRGMGESGPGSNGVFLRFMSEVVGWVKGRRRISSFFLKE